MYAVIDVETGGFSKEKNGLCEVAIIVLDSDYKQLESFTSLIRPYIRPNSNELVSYKEGAMAVNGIRLEYLDNAPGAHKVAYEIECLLENNNITTIIAHNAKTMDKPWLEYFLERFGIGFKFKHTICTLEIARSKKLPVANNKLPTLCEYFGITNSQEHRALGDTHATLELFLKLNQ